MADLGEKCAVFGIFGRGLDASRLAFFGLYALQHRGQESSGIATSDGKEVRFHRKKGLVAQTFTEKDIDKLVGHMAVGHNRYSTSKGTSIKHAQPTVIADVGLALVHNGNLPSTTALEKFLHAHHVGYTSLSDSEMIAEALAIHMRGGLSLEKAVRKVFPLMTGAFSILLMDKENLIAVRDTHGIRPLSIGTINGGFIFASETCAFHPIGAEFLRDVKAGEMVIVNDKGIRSVQVEKGEERLDVFEFVYFARPDSVLLGQSVYEVRRRFGEELAKECLIDADVVIPVPETAIPVALAYSQKTGIPLETGLIKNRYIHRTFIQPEQHVREQGVKMKLTPLPGIIGGKRVVVIDDSIVRGTTSKQIVKMLFDAGATEVNFLVSSPPVRFPDFYGIDTPSQKQLIAADKTIDEMRDFLGATRLHFLSYEGMIRATKIPESSLCTSCFTGDYPIDLKERKNEVMPVASCRLS